MLQVEGVLVMDGSYKRCPDCGKRALRIATRCPGCGAEFAPAEGQAAASQPAPSGPRTPRRLHPSTLLIGMLAAVGIFVASRVSRVAQPPEPSPTEVGSIGPSPAPAATLDTSHAFAAPAVASTAVVVAHRTVRVRKGRSRSAHLEALIVPGDTVTTDSLAQGWYRVTFEGEVMGYAEYSALEPPDTPSEATPGSP